MSSGRRTLVAGVDEVGRGPLAGPVVAAAVILSTSCTYEGLVDSKRLSPIKREHVSARIRATAQAWCLAAASAGQIDRLNIHQATLLAMRRAVLGLKVMPDYVLVDGRFYPTLPYRGEAVVRGDQSEPAISAASILAKVYRDRLMGEFDKQFPGYGFSRHKGYPTVVHLSALQVLGPCREHRLSFKPIRTLTKQAN
ncbi:MAG: ribonuclease HII [Acidiferrobacteraceae bacterium]|nr:ribonuclease HII [Acidiferrobacteraceae bacterium]MDP6950662.1 ribonuclease HII [Arenicellales bacterium]HJP07434.1 ribonuclease HII [Arenicellales bacterium]|tara:strand:- start:699 stop:1286 length:588 start_codon:yes stop_codon:yes gene_type:complete